MSTGDLPMMASSAYASTVYEPAAFGNLAMWQQGAGLGNAQASLSALRQDRRIQAPGPPGPSGAPNMPSPVIQPIVEKEPVMTRRLVQVLIADTHPVVPLDSALLYRGEPIFTDLADNELFFELDIKTMLAAHNEKRITFTAGKDKESLPPARVRDLKMNVVTIASF